MRQSQMDIFITLTITLSTITINLPYLGVDSILKDLFSILLLFISGYALLASLTPKNDIKIVIRALYSFLIGIGLLILIFVIEKSIYKSLIVTGPNLAILLSVLTITFIMVAYIRRKKYLDSIRATEEKLEEKEIEPQFLPRDLTLMFALAVLAIIFVLIPTINHSFITILFALPFLIFIPGYLLVYIMFPKKYSLEEMERLILSLGLSVIITPIFGIMLKYTPYGISLMNIFFILSIFTAVISIIAFIRRWRLGEGDRYIFSFRF